MHEIFFSSVIKLKEA